MARSPNERREALRRAARAERAAALLLADYRCDPRDAVPLLLTGWEHLREGAGTTEPGAEERVLRASPPDRRRELRSARAALGRAVRRAGGSTEPLGIRLLRPAGLVVVLVAVALAAMQVGGVLAERAERGWRGAYYPARGFEGEPVVRRDLEVRFHWFESPPYPGGPEDQFSVRWDSCLELPQDQRLEIRLGSDDGSRMFVDGEEVVDNWSDHGFRWNTENVDLEAGTHHVVVEYYDKSGKASIELKLVRPGLPEEPVPLEWLRVPRGTYDGGNACATAG